jgi:hypothetical protein
MRIKEVNFKKEKREIEFNHKNNKMYFHHNLLKLKKNFIFFFRSGF